MRMEIVIVGSFVRVVLVDKVCIGHLIFIANKIGIYKIKGRMGDR